MRGRCRGERAPKKEQRRFRHQVSVEANQVGGGARLRLGVLVHRLEDRDEAGVSVCVSEQ